MLKLLFLLAGQLIQIVNCFIISDYQFGYNLISKSYHGIDNVGLQMCARLCGMSTDCHSFNYRMDCLRCTLNYVDVTEASSALFLQDSRNVYGDSWAIEKDVELMGACTNHTCPEHTSCVVTTSGVKACIISGCGPPPNVTGADADVAPYPVAYIYTYTCLPTFQLVGGPITCLTNGNWTEPGVQCSDTQVVMCPMAPVLSNATAVGVGRNVGDNKTYVCASGTTANGSGDITCLAGGSWSPTSLVCEPDCTSASSQSATYSIPVQETSAAFGDFIWYTCQTGLTRVSGDGKRTCGPGGEWLPENIMCGKSE